MSLSTIGTILVSIGLICLPFFIALSIWATRKPKKSDYDIVAGQPGDYDFD